MPAAHVAGEAGVREVSRWAKRDDEEQPSIEQFELKFQEEVIKWQKLRESGVNIGALPVQPRKLSSVEVRYLEQKAEQREQQELERLSRELAEAGW